MYPRILLHVSLFPRKASGSSAEFTSESRRTYKVPTSRENHLFRVRVVDKPAFSVQRLYPRCTYNIFYLNVPKHET